MFDEKKFKAQMVLAGVTQKEVAEKLGIDEATFYRKMASGGTFTRQQISALIEILDIDDPMAIFFAEELA